jgi:glycosyltransferase involved in cell wall biosynthesis
MGFPEGKLYLKIILSTMPYLSIIVPVYNKEKYLDACIESILGQSFTDFELIIVNDGSTDGSALKCKKYAAADSRVVVIDQPNRGVSAARNRGLAIAKGVYTGFVDGDDSIDNDMYEILVKNVRIFEADISACRIRTVFPYKSVSPNETAGPISYNRNESLLKFFKGHLDMNLNNKIYRTAIVRNILFTGHIYEDILFMCKAFLQGGRTVVENVVKYNYILRDNSVSMSKFNEKYFETVGVSAEMLALVANERADIRSEAEVFDVTTNISLLNLLLLTGKDRYTDQYQAVVKRLKGYDHLLRNAGSIRQKHRYAFRLFSLSPELYAGLMYIYCRVTRSEVVKRS